MTRRSAVLTLAAASVGTACRTGSKPSAAPRSLDDTAQQYVKLTLELAQHQPSLVERWLGPAEWQPGPRRPVAEIRREIEAALQTMPAGEGEGTGDALAAARIRYLQQQLEALLVAARRLSGETISFVDEARAALGPDAAQMVESGAGRSPTGEAAIDAARANLEQRLPGRGPLHERYAAFRMGQALPAPRVLPTFEAAVGVCRRHVRLHIALPESERVHSEGADGLGLQGLAIYEGQFRSRVLIERSGPMDLARLVWLAAHEAYPGHHVQHVLADRDLVQARGYLERALHPAFGRHLLCAEGAAEAGAALLLDGEAFEEICREVATIADTASENIPDVIAVHRAVAALDLLIPAVARGYLDGEIGREAAEEHLRKDALVPDPQGFLFVIERQRTRLLAYPVGRRLVRSNVFNASGDRRWEVLARIATSLTLSQDPT